MNRTSIEWTHRPETGGAKGGFTWNPIRARRIDIHQDDHETKATGTFCTRISPGCTNCYASVINKRFGTGLEYTVPNLSQHEFYLDERILQEPLKRKKPATIFVGDMFDLFHEAIPQEFLDRVFAIAAICKQHTFQFLTKRADRMQKYFAGFNGPNAEARGHNVCAWADEVFGITSEEINRIGSIPKGLPNIWLGTSVESQKYADERIPLLLQTPAAVRFLSVEPLLEEIILKPSWILGYDFHNGYKIRSLRIDWIICGGESGPGARPFNLAWAESLLQQCREANVPFFMKQLGSNAGYISNGVWVSYRTKSKGGDMSEWPESLRVREFPQ